MASRLQAHGSLQGWKTNMLLGRKDHPSCSNDKINTTYLNPPEKLQKCNTPISTMSRDEYLDALPHFASDSGSHQVKSGNLCVSVYCSPPQLLYNQRLTANVTQ